jgi:hypothetical protein
MVLLVFKNLKKLDLVAVSKNDIDEVNKLSKKKFSFPIIANPK